MASSTAFGSERAGDSPGDYSGFAQGRKRATGHNKGGNILRFHFISDVLSIG